MDPILHKLQLQLTAAHAQFLHVVHQLKSTQREQVGVCGEWSPKDVVAHLIGWDSSLTQLIVDIEHFDPPYDVNAFNRQSVASKQHLSWTEVLTELESSFGALTQAIGSVDAEMKIYERVTGWLVGRIKDYELHTHQLEGWLS